MDIRYLFWAAGGALLGILYSSSIQQEIIFSQKKTIRVNPLFSMMRIFFCSAVLIFAFYQGIPYGLTCLTLFLVFKYLSLSILIKGRKDLR